MASAMVSEVTIKLGGTEAWALRNALGNMSRAAWAAIGINGEGAAAVEHVFAVLDEALHKPRADFEIKGGDEK